MARPSITDVAKAAGVSTATVSRALRGMSNVHAVTASRVADAARELGYSASPAARSLATGATRSIAIVCSELTAWFVSTACDAIIRAARDEGFASSLFVLGTGTYAAGAPGGRLRVKADQLRGRADAVIVVGLPLASGELAELELLGVPLVFVGPAAPGHPSIHIDEYEAARAATRHLLEAGHRAIGHVSGPGADDAEVGPPQLRLRGYLNALDAAGLAADEDLIAHCGYDRHAAHEATRDMVRRRPEITAVLAFCDEQAAGVLSCARALGRQVPGTLAVVGIDGSPLADVLDLTTLEQDPAAQGAAAVSVALDALTGTPVPHRIGFPVTLVRRATS